MTASGFLHILFFCGQAEKKKEEGPVHLFKSRPHRIRNVTFSTSVRSYNARDSLVEFKYNFVCK